MHRNRPIEILLGGAHLDGNARQLNHLSGIRGDDVAAQHPAAGTLLAAATPVRLQLLPELQP